MRIIKNILGSVFATWALLVFVITMLIFYIPFLFTGIWKEPKRTTYFIHLSRLWMLCFFILTGVRRVFKGKEYFKKGENYIVVCNHTTFMDVPLTSAGIPGAGNKTIAKKEFTRVPLFGIIYKRGSVLVDRKSDESRKASFLKMKEVLRLGLHMCIYPEGTRNKSKEPLQKFHDGAFRLSIESSKPIIPAVLFNTGIVMPRHKFFFFWPHKIEMHFLPPIHPTGHSVETLRDQTFYIMQAHYISKTAAKN